jgi:quercetin dioxygenase-like cupin family protein
MEPQCSVHSLNERAVRLKRSLSDMTGLSQFGFHLITLQPGSESTEYHRHLYEEECIYILSGNGEATIDDQVHEVGQGDFMGFARGGAAHTFRILGTPLSFLSLPARGWSTTFVTTHDKASGCTWPAPMRSWWTCPKRPQNNDRLA